MSTNGMDKILSRLFLDREFRQRLRNDPEQTIADFDLTPEQRARLFKLKKKTPSARQELPELTPDELNMLFSLN